MGPGRQNPRLWTDTQIRFVLHCCFGSFSSGNDIHVSCLLQSRSRTHTPTAKSNISTTKKCTQNASCLLRLGAARSNALREKLQQSPAGTPSPTYPQPPLLEYVHRGGAESHWRAPTPDILHRLRRHFPRSVTKARVAVFNLSFVWS